MTREELLGRVGRESDRFGAMPPIQEGSINAEIIDATLKTLAESLPEKPAGDWQPCLTRREILALRSPQDTKGK